MFVRFFSNKARRELPIKNRGCFCKWPRLFHNLRKALSHITKKRS